MEGDQTPLENPTYQALKRRWYILLIFGLMGTLQVIYRIFTIIRRAYSFYKKRLIPPLNNHFLHILGYFDSLLSAIAI